MIEFKVGDEVKILKPDSREGVIAKILKKDDEWAYLKVCILNDTFCIYCQLKFLEHIEPTKKFKAGDQVMYLLSQEENEDDVRIFIFYDEEGRVYYKNVTKGYGKCVADECDVMLRSEWEAQQKPQVGDKVWVKGTIVKTDDSEVPYKVDFSPDESIMGCHEFMQLWLTNVKKYSDLKD